ncbi:hypothetical protein [Metabacillus sp. Hm71]
MLFLVAAQVRMDPIPFGIIMIVTLSIGFIPPRLV